MNANVTWRDLVLLFLHLTSKNIPTKTHRHASDVSEPVLAGHKEQIPNELKKTQAVEIPEKCLYIY